VKFPPPRLKQVNAQLAHCFWLFHCSSGHRPLLRRYPLPISDGGIDDPSLSMNKSVFCIPAGAAP